MILLWGSLLILFGAQLIIQALFGINLPLIRVAFGLLIMYWGFILLTGQGNFCIWQKHSYKNFCISNASSQDTHNVIFGTQTIDLSDLNIDKPQTVTVNTVFGTAHIILNSNIPTRINTNTTFGTIILPDHSTITSGSRAYYTHDSAYKPALTINANSTFGTIVIKN